MIESLAYTLAQLATKQQGWQRTPPGPASDHDGGTWERVPWGACCGAGGSLPAEVLAAMAAADAAPSWRQSLFGARLRGAR